MGRITVTPDKLKRAIEQELTIYGEEVNESLREVTRHSMAKLVSLTKKTAPRGHRGTFRRNIAGDFAGLAKSSRTIRATWYVKAPEHRLTHLLVHGHATRNGGRTKPDPFLANALAEVLPEYEQAVKEALKK